METRSPNWKLLAVPVAFALCCVVVIGLAYRQLGGTLPLTAAGYRITVPLEDASGLVAGSDVRTAGVKIGRVVSVRRSGSAAQATIEVRPKFAPVHADAVAIPRTKTLLGEAFLEIEPGASTAPEIPDRGRMPAAQVRQSVRLDEFLGTFDRHARADVRALFGGMDRALDGRATEVSNSLGRFAPAATGLRDVLGALETQRPALGELFASSARLLDAVGRRSGELTGAVRSGDALLAITAKHRRDLGALVSEAGPFLAEVQRASRSATAASGDLRSATGALEQVSGQVRPALDALRTAAPSFGVVFRRLPSAISAAHRGLPALEDLVPATRSAFGALYPVARELIPFMQLLALNRTVPPSILANLGSALNGTFIGPGGKVLHYGTALPTVWNEMVSGWKRKLPTSRPFPYPKPGAMQDLAKLGYLKSYDCRHTGNRLYLPPTGSGAMPCVVQGPWTFDGRSAYYPRLLRAAP